MRPWLNTITLRRHQRGMYAVEFAFVAGIFLAVLIGVVEMGRVLFTWNAAVEATRFGARVAVVCDLNDTAVLTQMQKFLPNLTASNLSVRYLPSGCSVANCQQVQVELSGLTVQTFIPGIVKPGDPTVVPNPLSASPLRVPPFSTTLPRESLLSAIDGRPNPLCN